MSLGNSSSRLTVDPGCLRLSPPGQPRLSTRPSWARDGGGGLHQQVDVLSTGSSCMATQAARLKVDLHGYIRVPPRARQGLGHAKGGWVGDLGSLRCLKVCVWVVGGQQDVVHTVSL